MTAAQHDGRTTLRDVPWVPTAIAGGLAACVGYLLTAALFVVGPASITADVGIRFQLVQYAFVFYNAHLVDVVTVVADSAVPGGRTNLLLASTGGTAVPIPVYFAIPVVLLLAVAGHVTDRWLTRPTAAQVPLVGAAVALGYGLVLITGRFLATRTVSAGTQTATGSPDLVQTVAFGLAIPAIVATAGAGLALVIRRRLDQGP